MPDLALDLLTRLSTVPLPSRLLAADVGVPIRRRNLAAGTRCLMDLVAEIRCTHGIAVESRNTATKDGHCLWIRKTDWPRAMVLAQLYLNGEEL